MIAESKRFIRMEIIRPVRRARTLIRWKKASFKGVPIIFGNSMPKSGSKMLLQILKGMSDIGPFVETGGGPIRTITIKGRYRSSKEVIGDLQHFRPGDIGWGYLRVTPENLQFLCRPDWVSYLIIRDPRDMLISHIYYATEMYKGHGMHEYYQSISMDERLKTAIQGIHKDGLDMPDVRTRYEHIWDFLHQPEILVIRFENLILNREKTLNAMLEHLEAHDYQILVERSRAIQALMAAIDPGKSSTFRKGKVGDWRDHFNNEHKRLFKEVTDDLLIRLGYENNNDW